MKIKLKQKYFIQRENKILSLLSYSFIFFLKKRDELIIDQFLCSNLKDTTKPAENSLKPLISTAKGFLKGPALLQVIVLIENLVMFYQLGLLNP